MIITLGASTLCDGADRAVNKSCGPGAGWSISGRLGTQPAEALRARNARVFDRGNEITTLQFEINRLCSSVDVAIQWAALHAATVVRSGQLNIVSGALTLRIAAAALQDVQCITTGCSVRVSYTIVGGGMVQV